MLVVGFDPAFIDVTIQLLDKTGKLIDILPETGHHIRYSQVKRQAGGNGVNLSRTLLQLGIKHHLVTSANQEFEQLLAADNLIIHSRISRDINTTYALITSNGDIQINNIVSSIGENEWSIDINELWKSSEINTFLNWGLNAESESWVEKQVKAITEKNMINKPCLIDPGSIKDHRDRDALIQLLTHLMQNSSCILVCNEEEGEEYAQIPGRKIIHASRWVDIYDTETTRIEVPVLQCEHPRFVGAGDAFLAGVLIAMKDGVIDLVKLAESGIRIAQYHLCDSFP